MKMKKAEYDKLLSRHEKPEALLGYLAIQTARGDDHTMVIKLDIRKPPGYPAEKFVLIPFSDLDETTNTFPKFEVPRFDSEAWIVIED